MTNDESVFVLGAKHKTDPIGVASTCATPSIESQKFKTSGFRLLLRYSAFQREMLLDCERLFWYTSDSYPVYSVSHVTPTSRMLGAWVLFLFVE